jgi:RNA polymerase sigma-70 factor (ECF subfamily)
MSNQPENTGVDSLQAKRDMFVHFYKKHRPSIFNYIFYRVGDPELADDLTSDVFVRMVDKYDLSVREDRSIAPWLYAIARNLVIDHYRRTGRIGWQSLPDQAPAGETSNPVRRAEERTLQECLMKALDYLTEDQRQVILLKFIERRTNQEIGNLLGKPEGAIKSLQHRALAGLRRALEKEPCYEDRF